MMKKLVVWDVDGTLVDSRRTIFESAVAVYAELGLPAPAYDEVRQIVGLQLREGLGVLLPQLPGAELDRAVEASKNAFQGILRRPRFIDPPYDGAAETL